MRKLAICTIVAALLCASPVWAAKLQNVVEVCGNTKASAQDIVHFCRMALDSGKLDTLARAQVNANLGVGFFELGDYRQAIEAYTAALRGAPDMVAAYVNRARAYDRLGRLAEAAADYGTALRLDPGAADAHLGLGALLLRNGDPRRAVTEFDAAISLRPAWGAARFNRGLALLRLGRYQNAARDFSAVIEQTPDDAAAYMNRGLARSAANLPGAAEDFDKALELDPESGGTWFARGRFRDAHGQREAANADFLRAYELGYSDPWLIRRVREISG